MKEQIKELRIRIDGVSQLVKELNKSALIDINKITVNINSPEDAIALLKAANNSPMVMIEASNKPIVEYIEKHEISKCYESLILAKAWLGKVLGELGETTPYANDGNRKSVEDIEPTADKNTMIEINTNKPVLEEFGWKSKSYIEKVDWLRQEIQLIVNIVKDIYISNYQVSREFNIARTNSYNHLCEARFWLGFELQRIKEQSDKSFQIHILKEEGINFNK